jgi:hypothetical protein
MKHIKHASFLLAALLAVGCGLEKSSHSVTTPSIVDSGSNRIGAASHYSVELGLGTPETCNPSVVWSESAVGAATVTNNSSVPCDYLLIVWEATDEVNQVGLSQFGRTLQPGETADFSLSFPIVCDMKLQRDIYSGIKPAVAALYTMSDVRNYFETGDEKFLYTDICDLPPTPETPLVPEIPEEEPELCTDDSANNYGGSLPCTYDEEPPPCPEGYYYPQTFGGDHGDEEDIPEGCVVIPPPPPQDIAWCHVAALPSGVVENDLSIPQTSIDNGHDDHELDYPGPCDGRSENLQTYYYYDLGDIDDGDWGLSGASNNNAGTSDGNSDNDDDRSRFCSAQGGLWLNDSNDPSGFNPSGSNICRVANTVNFNANRSGSSNDFTINASDLEDTHIQ